MGRIKIQMPESFNFSCQIPVRITDVNYGGHVGNNAILGIIHEARLQFLRSFGFSEMDFGGVSLIMADVAIEFKAEAFYGDECIISAAFYDIQKLSFDICYRIEKKVPEKNMLVAIAKTGMVCFNYQSRQVAPIPENALIHMDK